MAWLTRFKLVFLVLEETITIFLDLITLFQVKYWFVLDFVE
jgi:hypothetical protein